MTAPARTEDLLRELAPQVLGALVRRYGQFDACEDAVQEAMLAASLQWAEGGLPESPKAWLFAVASRRLVDEWRSESARRRREETTVVSEEADADQVSDQDDTLTLLFLCCHPSLSEPSQLALTLRAVGGLTTAEIANAFLVPEATMAQRISRAKQRIKSTGIPFGLPPVAERGSRLRVVLHVLYLVFNEGYTTSSGPELQRTDLTTEAIRLTRLVHRVVPEDGEVAGLLALMLLTDARRAARSGADGSLIILAEQNRQVWNADAIAEGVALVSRTLGKAPIGPYQLQAAIAAVHDEGPRPPTPRGGADWPVPAPSGVAIADPAGKRSTTTTTPSARRDLRARQRLAASPRAARIPWPCTSHAERHATSPAHRRQSVSRVVGAASLASARTSAPSR